MFHDIWHGLALRHAPFLLATLLAAVACLGSRVRADSPERFLTSRGLKASGWVYVVDGEAPFNSKMVEAKALHKAWADTQARLDEQHENQAMIDELTQQINALKSDIAAWKQRQVAGINSNPQAGGFGQNAFGPQGGLGPGGGFGQNAFTPQFQNLQNLQITEQIIQADQSRAQLTEEVNQLKKLTLSPDEKKQLQEEGEQRREKLRNLVVELRKSADAVAETYKGLHGDSAVQQALASLGQANGSKPRLGPSRTFQADVKTLEKIERALASGGTRTAKASKFSRKHKSKSGSASKRSAARTKSAQ